MEILKRFFGVKKTKEYYDKLVEMDAGEYREQQTKEQEIVHKQLDNQSPQVCDWRAGDFRCYKGQTVVPPYLDEPLGICNECGGTGIKKQEVINSSHA